MLSLDRERLDPTWISAQDQAVFEGNFTRTNLPARD
jgi:hypothetical protein